MDELRDAIIETCESIGCEAEIICVPTDASPLSLADELSRKIHIAHQSGNVAIVIAPPLCEGSEDVESDDG